MAGERLEERRFGIWEHFWGGRNMMMGGDSEAVGEPEWIKNVLYFTYVISYYSIDIIIKFFFYTTGYRMLCVYSITIRSGRLASSK